MSYILDALRKSEADRQHAHAAGVADIPSRRNRAGTPQWVWLLAALLLVNAAALVYLTLAPDDAAPTTPVSAAPSGAAPVAAPPVAIAPVSTPAAQQATVTTAAEPAALPPASEPAEASSPAAAAPPVQTERTAPPAAAPSPGVTEATLMELRANGQINIPDLHLDIHVYSREPADRFVFINMSKYRERERLKEGPQIREIIENGVILEHGNHRFLLPRE